ncbi:hypothetical protein [Streptomyces flavofungini]|uniref:hypothetical protein n=1 Tax=Streptomyces flavofungini TaxID=68200 RepID=UPI0025B21EEE|nr:hypothetical protein [Streptomyces flavofungini]WJV48886.1 hypothetical protein QUY26_27265 [Streptomyces flavofungini]
MRRPLARAYWCHLDVRPRTPERSVVPGAAVEPLPPSGVTTPHPQVALSWLRAEIRDLAVVDSASSSQAQAWLEDRMCADAILRELRRQFPVSFELNTPMGTWAWAIRPVSVLPLLAVCREADHFGLPPIVFWTQRP